ncbi:MAG: hypothetical protein LUC93_14365 [Planctomycetaceae bacterium]|nr:hypothetical protein [Planctomycetaceae bacterium]
MDIDRVIAAGKVFVPCSNAAIDIEQIVITGRCNDIRIGAAVDIYLIAACAKVDIAGVRAAIDRNSIFTAGGGNVSRVCAVGKGNVIVAAGSVDIGGVIGAGNKVDVISVTMCVNVAGIIAALKVDGLVAVAGHAIGPQRNGAGHGTAVQVYFVACAISRKQRPVCDTTRIADGNIAIAAVGIYSAGVRYRATRNGDVVGATTRIERPVQSTARNIEITAATIGIDRSTDDAASRHANRMAAATGGDRAGQAAGSTDSDIAGCTCCNG